MTLDIIIPVYNEHEAFPIFLKQVLNAFSGDMEFNIRVLIVNDGSTDGTDSFLDEQSRSDERIQVIHLWGNHGHQKALIAGMDASTADLVLMMDGDGQHPVSAAVEMVQTLCEHQEVYIVQGVRKGEQNGIFKNLTSKGFYWLVNRLMRTGHPVPNGASDFRVLRKEVVEVMKRYPDRYRNVRVLIASLGLPTYTYSYTLDPRIAGSSGYSFKKMLRLATDGCFAFSSVPLHVSFLLMIGSGFTLCGYLIYILVMFFSGKTIPGWTSLIGLMIFLFMVVFGVLTIISEYISRIYEDVRGHPVYTKRPEIAKLPSAPLKNGKKESPL